MSLSADWPDTVLRLSSNDRYRAQLNGAGAATQYDVITVVNGTASVADATLEVVPGFTPSIGQQFNVLNTTGGVTGFFRDTVGNVLTEGATFCPHCGAIVRATEAGASGAPLGAAPAAAAKPLVRALHSTTAPVSKPASVRMVECMFMVLSCHVTWQCRRASRSACATRDDGPGSLALTAAAMKGLYVRESPDCRGRR